MTEKRRVLPSRRLRKLGRRVGHWIGAILRGMFVLGAALGPGMPPPPPPPPPAVEQNDGGAPEDDNA